MELYTAEEAARILKLSGYTVRRMLKSGRLRAVKVGGGRQWRIHKADLEAYLQGSYKSSTIITGVADAAITDTDITERPAPYAPDQEAKGSPNLRHWMKLRANNRGVHANTPAKERLRPEEDEDWPEPPPASKEALDEAFARLEDAGKRISKH